MAGLDNNAPSLDSSESTLSESSAENSFAQGAALFSLDDLRAAEAEARKAAEQALKLLPVLPPIPGLPEKPPRGQVPKAPEVKKIEPVKPPTPAPIAPAPQPEAAPAHPATKIGSSELSSLFEKNFDKLDTDNNGFVSEVEIDKAMASNEFKGKDALLVDVLKRHRDDLQSLTNDEWGPETNGVSKADMQAFDSLRKSGGQVEVVADVDKTLKRAANALDGATCREPFSDKQNPAASVRPEAIMQGRIKDGYFLAALGSLAANNPEAIASMIKDNGNGTYTVKFPGDPDNPVTVSTPTDSELARYAGGTQYGTWPAILEKAFGAKRGSNTVLQDGAESDFASKSAMRLLNTGGVDTDFVALTDSGELDDKMSQAFQDKVPVTARAAQGWSGVGLGDNRTDGGVPRGQDYSVVGYDAKSQTVTLRNPRGGGEPMNADGSAKDGKNDGTFSMTLEEFQRNFNEVSYGQV